MNLSLRLTAISASKKAKAGGLKSLREMSEIINIPKTTLNDWEKTKPVAFDALIIGAVELKKRQQAHNAMFSGPRPEHD